MDEIATDAFSNNFTKFITPVLEQQIKYFFSLFSPYFLSMSVAICVVCLTMLGSVKFVYFQMIVVLQYSPSSSERPMESGTISGSSYCQQSWPPLS